MEAKADPLLVNIDNETALDLTKESNHLEIVKMLEVYMATYPKK
jgi:hypothetical protein